MIQPSTRRATRAYHRYKWSSGMASPYEWPVISMGFSLG